MVLALLAVEQYWERLISGFARSKYRKVERRRSSEAGSNTVSTGKAEATLRKEDLFKVSLMGKFKFSTLQNKREVLAEAYEFKLKSVPATNLILQK
jgi:hypothetical protein